VYVPAINAFGPNNPVARFSAFVHKTNFDCNVFPQNTHINIATSTLLRFFKFKGNSLYAMSDLKTRSGINVLILKRFSPKKIEQMAILTQIAAMYIFIQKKYNLNIVFQQNLQLYSPKIGQKRRT
jgi:hypothetical protein